MGGHLEEFMHRYRLTEAYLETYQWPQHDHSPISPVPPQSALRGQHVETLTDSEEEDCNVDIDERTESLQVVSESVALQPDMKTHPENQALLLSNKSSAASYESITAPEPPWKRPNLRIVPFSMSELDAEADGKTSKSLRGLPPTPALHKPSANETDFLSSPSFVSLLRPPSSYDPYSLAKHYGRSGRTKHDHHKRFWLGEKYREAFTLGVIRAILLGNAIYVASLILIFVPSTLKTAGLTRLQASVLIFVSLLPIGALLNMAPDVVEDFAIVTSIQSMKNNRMIEQSLRRMATRYAFCTLKVVYMLAVGTQEDRKRVDNGGRSGIRAWRTAKQKSEKKMRKKISTPRSGVGEFYRNTTPGKVQLIPEALSPAMSPGEQAWATHVQSAIDEESRLAALESAERTERVWIEIFNVFDSDRNGTISPKELRLSLEKMIPPGALASQDFDYIVSEIDSDGSGEIDFHECVCRKTRSRIREP